MRDYIYSSPYIWGIIHSLWGVKERVGSLGEHSSPLLSVHSFPAGYLNSLLAANSICMLKLFTMMMFQSLVMTLVSWRHERLIENYCWYCAMAYVPDFYNTPWMTNRPVLKEFVIFNFSPSPFQQLRRFGTEVAAAKGSSNKFFFTIILIHFCGYT